jgi:hypothetical protein
MTGDIKEILLSSDAANSLRMEARVASLLNKNGWPGELGMYYKDLATGKPREVDVYCNKVLKEPERYDGVGGPILNVYLYCECKSLAGSNILFSEGSPPDYFVSHVPFCWVGQEDNLRLIARKLAEQADVADGERLKALYDYAVNRAYLNGKTEQRAVVPTPPVDLLARSFRETKRGNLENDRMTDQTQSSPVWNAIRSSRSAAEAGLAHARGTSLDWIYGRDLAFTGCKDFIRYAAFFLDAELFRTSCFHPFVVLNARLWHLKANEISEIDSARVLIHTIDHDDFYVDIVNAVSIEKYIKSLTSHFKKHSLRHIKKQWNWIEKNHWRPGREAKRLGEALGIVLD